MTLSPLGNITRFNPLQYQNALYPITVTLSGTVNDLTLRSLGISISFVRFLLYSTPSMAAKYLLSGLTVYSFNEDANPVCIVLTDSGR